MNKKQLLEKLENYDDNHPIYLGTKILHYKDVNDNFDIVELETPRVANSYYLETVAMQLTHDYFVLFYGGNIDFNKKAEFTKKDIVKIIEREPDDFDIFICNEKGDKLEKIIACYQESTRLTLYGEGDLPKEYTED